MAFDLVDAARAAEILGSRWENDPLRLWSPFERQRLFLECKKSEAALLGANRGGKSDPLAALCASLARFGNPNPITSDAAGGRIEIMDRAVSIWVIGLTEKLVKEGIQPKIVTTALTAAETHPAFIPNEEIHSSNINDQIWRLKNGSLIGFKTADAGREVFQSASRDAVLFDEICEWEVYKEATFRVPGGGRRLLIRLAATLLPPLGMAGGVSWYFPQKIRPWQMAGNRENQTGNQDKFLDIFTLGIRHNPHINRDEIERLERMFPPGSLEARIRLDGELLPSIGGTIAYTGYRESVHFQSKITPDRRDDRYPLALCCDFNVSPCVWVVGQYIDKTWFFFDEIVLDQCNLSQMVAEFRRKYPTHGAPLYIYGDQTGVHRNVQTGESNYDIIQECFVGYPVPVELKLPETNPLVSDRLNAVNRAFSGSDGRIGIVFGPNCIEIKQDCEEVLRDHRGGIKKVSDPSNPYFFRTHGMDAVGYAVCFTDPVPRFIADIGKVRRHIPSPGYLNYGGQKSTGGYPRSYDADGRLRFGRSGAVLPPRRYGR
jgi:hypothetical protein